MLFDGMALFFVLLWAVWFVWFRCLLYVFPSEAPMGKDCASYTMSGAAAVNRSDRGCALVPPTPMS